MSPLDPVTFEVIWHRLLDITEEMGIKYMRTSGSPVLVGAYDASTGITLPDGQLVAIGPYITTQGHVLPLIVSATQERCAVNPGIGPGDLFLCNDPYLGATHQPDVATVGPVFVDGEPIAWVGASGHWLDIGGSEPGGFSVTATSVFDEGLRMPPTRIVETGVVREDLVALVMNQVRDQMAELDLRGQVVAAQTGVERLTDLCGEYGADVVVAVMREAIDHVERRLRARLRELPDGEWREIQYIDDDGSGESHEIVCSVRKIGDRLIVDFRGTSPEATRFVNCTYGGLRAAVLSALGIVLAWDLPWNEGLARVVELVVPPRSVVSAEYPAPVSMATITPIILALNAAFAAFSKMLLMTPAYRHEAMANWCGTSLAPTITGRNERGTLTVNGETSHFAAGCGARTYADGVDTGGIVINTTASIPSIEAVESEYPVLYLLRRQLTDSGGAGMYRGGMAGEVALTPYHTGGPLESTFAGCGAAIPNAFGLAGGLPASAARFVRFSSAKLGLDTDHQVGELPVLEEDFGEGEVSLLMIAHRPFALDVIEYHSWQGGGGFGDPLDRDPEAVAADVRESAVSRSEALRVYGVLISDDGSANTEPTERERQRARDARLLTGRVVSAELLARMALRAPEHGTAPSAPVEVGRAVCIDTNARVVSCLRCNARLGDPGEDYRAGALVEVSETSEAGPSRGQDYRTGAAELLRFYCPGCGHQIDAVVARPKSLLPAFRLAVPN